MLPAYHMLVSPNPTGFSLTNSLPFKFSMGLHKPKAPLIFISPEQLATSTHEFVKEHAN